MYLMIVVKFADDFFLIGHGQVSSEFLINTTFKHQPTIAGMAMEQYLYLLLKFNMIHNRFFVHI